MAAAAAAAFCLVVEALVAGLMGDETFALIGDVGLVLTEEALVVLDPGFIVEAADFVCFCGEVELPVVVSFSLTASCPFAANAEEFRVGSSADSLLTTS